MALQCLPALLWVTHSKLAMNATYRIILNNQGLSWKTQDGNLDLPPRRYHGTYPTKPVSCSGDSRWSPTVLIILKHFEPLSGQSRNIRVYTSSLRILMVSYSRLKPVVPEVFIRDLPGNRIITVYQVSLTQLIFFFKFSKEHICATTYK